MRSTPKYQTNINLGSIYFMKIDFLKIIFQTFMCLFVIRKVGQWKTLSSKNKLVWFQKKCFFFILNGKHFSKIMKNFEKIINVMLFTNYIKFDTQIFYCYIFCFDFFSISPLKIWFNLIFKSTLVLIFMIVIYFSLIIFLIKNFYLSDMIFIILSEIIYEIIFFFQFHSHSTF
jgi:hypothetical protein